MSDTIPLLSPVGSPVHYPPQQSPPFPQLVFDEVEESHHSIDNSIDSDIDDSFEMAESSILAPPVFRGRSDQAPENFLKTT